MVIGPDRWADWLNPDNDDPGDLESLLAPATSAGLATRAVSTEVNSVRHNGPQLTAPAEPVDAAPAGEPPAHPGKAADRPPDRATSGEDPATLF